MSKSERIKEQIGWLKVIFAILMAIDISLIGWLANHYDKIDVSEIKIYLNLAAIMLVSLVVIFVNKIAFKKIDELEDL